MKEADFTDLVRQKIEERRDGRSAAVRAAAEADDRFRALAAPVIAAASELVNRMSADAMFSNAMRKPEVTVRRTDKEGRRGHVIFEGEAGGLLFDISASDEIWMQIMPNYVVTAALDCGLSYAIEPVKGDLSRIGDFIDRVRDHVAEYLADIYLNPAAHLLEPRPEKPGHFGRRDRSALGVEPVSGERSETAQLRDLCPLFQRRPASRINRGSGRNLPTVRRAARVGRCRDLS